MKSNTNEEIRRQLEESFPFEEAALRSRDKVWNRIERQAVPKKRIVLWKVAAAAVILILLMTNLVLWQGAGGEGQDVLDARALLEKRMAEQEQTIDDLRSELALLNTREPEVREKILTVERPVYIKSIDTVYQTDTLVLAQQSPPEIIYQTLWDTVFVEKVVAQTRVQSFGKEGKTIVVIDRQLDEPREKKRRVPFYLRSFKPRNVHESSILSFK